MSRIDAKNAKEALDRIDRTTLNQIKSEVSSVNKETTELARNANTSANAYRDASGRMRNANGQFVKSADDAKRAVDSFGKANAAAGKSTDNFSSKLKISSADLLSYGKSAALAGAALVVLYAKNLLESGIKYESALNKFQAATKATDDQMKLAAAKAKELGKDLKLPATSAGDAALAMTELAKSNFDFNESMAATRGVLLWRRRLQPTKPQPPKLQQTRLTLLILKPLNQRELLTYSQVLPMRQAVKSLILLKRCSNHQHHSRRQKFLLKI